MKNALKVLSWIQIVVGGLAFLGLLSESGDNLAGILVCGLLIATGIVGLRYIASQS